MKIYQIHYIHGDDEYYSDTILSSYLDKNKADTECSRLIAKYTKDKINSDKCDKCPLVNTFFLDLDNEVLSATRKHCSKFELDTKGYSCLNYSYVEVSDYKIVEVDVIE